MESSSQFFVVHRKKIRLNITALQFNPKIGGAVILFLKNVRGDDNKKTVNLSFKPISQHNWIPTFEVLILELEVHPETE